MTETMRDTATASHYEELVRVNADLAAGVVGGEGNHQRMRERP